jgi:hypothetical protein
MKPVDRSELLDLGSYERIRDRFRQRVVALKRQRRLELGSNMSLVFENHDTVLLQIQEMLRTERISDERAIAHELETYNELIPRPGQLSATLFIEYEDAAQRRVMLERLATLRESVHLRIGERRATARFGTHFGEELDRLPAVNYLTFDPGPEAGAALAGTELGAAIEITHPDYPLVLELPPQLRRELASDLSVG